MADLLERLTAALADRYAIERELGSGGMATVYLAEDHKHHRHVAVKVLRPELAAVLGGERFLREIAIAAKLNHLHILALHDSGEADGFLYYVMPFVEGESLRAKLAREKQLAIDEAVSLTSQVASALDYAHQQDVIHRDIKPENILLHRGEAVVADFGIALAVTAAGGERLTETGLSLGTPEYMSPEQASGVRDVGARSDIYSLGAVLYEMVTGEPPQRGATVQAVMAKLLSERPTRPRIVRDSVPEAMDRAIIKALAKVPADRFASAGELAAALTAEAERPEADVKSIVVLPFENLSPDPDQEYFSDGLTEEVISDLSRIRSLRVISRSSAMTFKGSRKRIPDIARELHVRYALEGSVRKAGNSLRITAQLIDAEEDAHIWSDKYSGTLEDVFDMQERVSQSIVAALQLTLTPSEQRQMAERPIENVAAYECYVRAKASALESTHAGAYRALQHLQEAHSIIGDNALLYAGMAFTYWQLVNLGARQGEYLEKAHECVDKALVIDPMCADAYAVLGWIGHLEGDFARAARSSQRALAINPDHAFALASLAAAYGVAGKTSVASQVLDRLVQLDPLDFVTQWLQALMPFYDGQFDRAVPLARKFVQQYPAAPYAEFGYAIALIYSGQHEAAVPVIDRNAEANPDNAVANVGLALKYGVQNDKAAAYAAMTSDFVKTCQRDATFAHHLAGAFAMLGESTEALNWLETAVEAGFVNYPMLAHHDPLLSNIRGADGFKTLMARVKREWEEFQV